MAPAPSPPRDLDETSRRLFTATREALTEQGTWQDSDAQLLERYVRSGETARTAREVVKRDGLTVEGSKGQSVPHPLLKVILDAERDMDKRAEMLLLSPSARQRIHGAAPKPAKGESKFGLG